MITEQEIEAIRAQINRLRELQWTEGYKPERERLLTSLIRRSNTMRALKKEIESEGEIQ